jgi:hypothetical protein
LEVNYISIQEIPLFQPNKMSPLQGLVFQIAMFLLPKYRLFKAWSRKIIFPAIKGLCKKSNRLSWGLALLGLYLVEECITEEIPKAPAGRHFLTYKLWKIFSFQAVSLASR